MASSDLAKYSVTQSIARSLCDSWSSCLLSIGEVLFSVACVC